jgi:hypothetical protein
LVFSPGRGPGLSSLLVAQRRDSSINKTDAKELLF